jgi:transcriptional regulator with XRE-family HTH domain
MKSKSKRPVNLRLKAAIALAGKTMTEVAEAIGTPKSNLSLKINGHGRFNENEMYLISKFLNVSVTDIFFDPEVHKMITKKQKGA